MIQTLSALLILLGGAIGSPAQEKALPPNYKVVLSQGWVRVIRVHYGPHEQVPVHTHPETPTIYVYLNDGPAVRFTHYENPPFSLVRPPTHKGAFRISPGRLERHTAENLGDTASDYLRVELPGFRIGEKNLDFRGQAPADLSHSSTATEFASPGLSVARTICAGPEPCAIKPTAARSLVVALSNLVLIEKEEREKSETRRIALQIGDVFPLAPSHQFTLAAETDAPAHILQISAPEAPSTKP